MRILSSLRPIQRLYLVIAIVLVINYFVLGDRVENEGASPATVAAGSDLRQAFDEQRFGGSTILAGQVVHFDLLARWAAAA